MASLYKIKHSNEQSAKEAALRLIRDLAGGDLSPLLKKINVLVIPQANPYGNYFDLRQNETGLDLNRDHVKLEGDSTRAIHRVFSLYQPEVTMDIHEKGDDYYRVSVGCVSNLNIHQSLQDYSRNIILKEIEKKLARKRSPSMNTWSGKFWEWIPLRGPGWPREGKGR